MDEVLEVTIKVYGPTLSFTLDESGHCIAAKSSEDGIDTPIDSNLFELLDEEV